MGVDLGGNEHVLELDSGDSCKTLNILKLNWIFKKVNFPRKKKNYTQIHMETQNSTAEEEQR